MKIAITGKGGAGKTTFTSLLAHHYAAKGRPVLAIDADPSPCLGEALGIDGESLQNLTPISQMKDLIAERTGTSPDRYSTYFKINPRVDDIPENYSLFHKGIRLLMLGAVEQGGSGCICPSSTLLKNLITHILFKREDVVLLDLYAGVEHLGRSTADSVDAMVAVVEPTLRSIKTARQIKKLAEDIGIHQLYMVGNKVNGTKDEAFIEENAREFTILGYLPISASVMTADRTGADLYSLDSEMARIIQEIVEKLEMSLCSVPRTRL